jgi:tape measure domain-containing protein
MDIATLGLEIRSDGVVVAKDRLRDFDGQAALTEKRAAAMGAVVAKAMGLIGAALGVRELVGYADAWSDLQSRVGAAIKDMDAAPALMRRMVDLANASYSPLSQTVEVYSRNVGILRDLGYSAGQAADFTEALNHALVVTATRGERAASVQNALSKAMAVGRLQADGLETVLANGGRVAEALAEELGTTVSGLRKMASEGKITGDVIARALTGRLGELREEAAKMPATIGDAFTRIQTNLTALIGTLDKTHDVSGRVAEAILVVADNLEMIVPIAGALATVLVVSMVPAIASTTAGWIALTAAMLANPFVQVGLLAGALAGTILYLNQQQGLAAQAAQAHAEALTTNANAIEVAKTSSQGFRDGLRSQIELQVAAARAALDEAGAQYQAAKARAANAEIFNKVMNLGANIIGLPGDDRQYGAGIMQKALDEINIKYDQLTALEGQLSKLGEVETSYKPIEHTISGLTGVGTAAAAANDNVKTLGNSLTDAARAAAQEWDFYRGTFSSFMSDFRRDLMNGTGLWQSFANAATKALDSIADRAMSMAANGLFDMLFGSFMGAIPGMGGGMFGKSMSTPLGFGGTAGFYPAFPSFNGGGHTGYGPRSGGLDGLGGFPAILHPNETVIDHTKPYAANQNAAPQRVQIEMSVSVDETGNIVPFVRQVAGEEADVRVDFNNRKVMPRMINDLKSNSMVVNS